MLSSELRHLRSSAHRFLLNADRSCTSQELARHLFGPRRHEEPVAQLLVRSILKPARHIVQSHDGRWSAADSPFLTQPLDELRFAVVDLETTGSLIGVDRIIEVGIAIVEDHRITQTFSSLVHSSHYLSGRIRRLTGIHPHDLIDAPAFDEVAPIVNNLLDGCQVFVGHDVRFDYNFLNWELERHGKSMPELLGLCTLRLAQQLWPDIGGWRLQDLAGMFEVAHDRPHRAGEDALATAGVLGAALDDAATHGASTLADLYGLPAILRDGCDGEHGLAAQAAG